MTSTSSLEFPSRRDVRIVGLLCGVAAVEVVGAVLVGAVAPNPRAPGIVVALLLLLSAGLMVWCAASTAYRVEGGDLRIRCGPFRWRVAISAIDRVYSRRSAAAAPALSTDRLVIECSRLGRTLEVSPDRPDAFVEALKTVNPRIVA